MLHVRPIHHIILLFSQRQFPAEATPSGPEAATQAATSQTQLRVLDSFPAAFSQTGRLLVNEGPPAVHKTLLVAEVATRLLIHSATV